MSEPNKGGRPSKFIPSIKERVVEAIEKGASYDLACNYAGVSYRTFRHWMVKGEKGEDGFFQFYQTVKKAEGIAVDRWLSYIEKAAERGQ